MFIINIIHSLFFSFFACQNTPSEALKSEAITEVDKVTKETEIDSNQIKKTLDVDVKSLQKEKPVFDPVKHRHELLSNTKSNQTSGELYVRVTGVDAHPKSNFKARMERAGRSKIRKQAQYKDVPLSSIDMESLEVRKASCNDRANTCSANFKVRYGSI